MNLLSKNSEDLLIISGRNLSSFSTVSSMQFNNLSGYVAVLLTDTPYLVLRYILLSNVCVDVDGVRITGAPGATFMINI